MMKASPRERELPHPTKWILSHNHRCTLVVAFEQRWERGEHRTTILDRESSKTIQMWEARAGAVSSLLASLDEEGGISTLNHS